MPIRSHQENLHSNNTSALRTRPTYESRNDLDNERFVIDLLYKRKYHKVSRAYVADLFGINPTLGVPMLTELKTRTKPLSAMKNGVVILSYLKYTNLRSYDIPCTFMVMCPDGLWEIPIYSCEKLSPHNIVDVTLDGRVDRGDPNDLEPCVKYKISNFKQILKPKPLEILQHDFKRNGGLSPETIQRVLKETSD